jgi:hypothetical protein
MVRPGNQTREVVDTTIIVIISSLRIMTDSALKDRKQEEARAKLLRPAGAPRKCDRTRLLYDLCFKNAIKRKKELVKSFSVLFALSLRPLGSDASTPPPRSL